ncbi:Ribonuclease H-like domain [Trinorchestia longiramus]|nr:Ribonuclease H-like domain [Trinorchestia longiramus]
MPIPNERFHIVHVDILGPLPPSQDQRYMLTCVDRFIRWCTAIPMKDCTAETTTRTFRRGICNKSHGSTTNEYRDEASFHRPMSTQDRKSECSDKARPCYDQKTRH